MGGSLLVGVSVMLLCCWCVVAALFGFTLYVLLQLRFLRWCCCCLVVVVIMFVVVL